jgi:hypothetical protein
MARASLIVDLSDGGRPDLATVVAALLELAPAPAVDPSTHRAHVVAWAWRSSRRTWPHCERRESRWS